MNYSHKEQATFNENNRARVEDLLTAGQSIEKLRQISPSSIVLDLTWLCNYKCMNCIDERVVKHDGDEGKTASRDMPLEIIEDIFLYAKTHGVRGINTMGGEVFSYKEGMTTALTRSIEYQIPLKTVSNGSKLEEYSDLIVAAYSIDGANLRVSINGDRNHYHLQTGQIDVVLDDVLASIQTINSQGGNITISTIVFPASASAINHDPNIDQIEYIVKAAEQAGVKSMILLPGRDPHFMKRLGLTEQEKDTVRQIKVNNPGIDLYIQDITKDDKEIFAQNLDFHPCHAAFLYTLIGSDGTMYMCTDHRGNQSGVLTKISKPGDFESYWHSEKRVQQVLDFVAATQCKNMTCLRYDVNSRFQKFAEEFRKTGVIAPDFIVTKDKRFVFI